MYLKRLINKLMIYNVIIKTVLLKNNKLYILLIFNAKS